MNRVYIAIDLKSFFASVECVKRNLDPLDTNLVVADESRTNKTICLAVTPSLKSYGISGRPRLFEVINKVKEINYERLKKTKDFYFIKSSYSYKELSEHDNYELDYIVAKPCMADYISYSGKIYDIYLKYIALEDIHIYSIDEVFMDVTSYLNLYKLSAHDLAMIIIKDVLKTTGITATAGIGPNLYLAKVAMDILAKKVKPDKDGVRIAMIDNFSYREKLWDHTPITDFWRVGPGYANKLAKIGLYTMGDVARYSINNEEKLYKLFGINAELLIDHAWGEESCLISDIKKIKLVRKSISSGQVLHKPYDFNSALLVIKEMADLLALDLVEKGYLTKQIVINIGYDTLSLEKNVDYKGEVVTDFYGRMMPKHAHGTFNFQNYTSASYLIVDAISKLYEKIVDPSLLIRKINIAACNLILEKNFIVKENIEQINLFEDYMEMEQCKIKEKEKIQKDKQVQQAILKIKHKYGKNAILKGMNLLDDATTVNRNKQIGGHNA